MRLIADAHHRPSAAPSTEPASTHTSAQFEVVHPDVERRVSEGLQHGDLLALRRHQAGQHDVEQERRHAQEDCRHDRAEDAVLADLVRQEAV